MVQQGVACVAAKGRTCLRSEAGGRSSCLASSVPWAGRGRVEALGGAGEPAEEAGVSAAALFVYLKEQ